MDKELKKYIITNIKSKYKTFDKAHNIAHFLFVTENCVKYSNELIKKGIDVNPDIAYIAGAYHDIGLINGRENHAQASGEFVRNDKMLAKYYSKEIVEIIAQAVEDHSSHLTYCLRNIYGKIVADSDRNNTMYLVFSRPIKYALSTKPEITSKAEYLEEVYNFVNNKFGRNGYIKYWLDIPSITLEQEQIWKLLDNKELCFQYILGIFDEITKGKFKY